jgi:hypothetical protein
MAIWPPNNGHLIDAPISDSFHIVFESRQTSRDEQEEMSSF